MKPCCRFTDAVSRMECRFDYPLRGVRPRFFLLVVSYNILIYLQRQTVCQNGAQKWVYQGEYPLIPTYKEFNIFMMSEFENML